MSAPYLLASYMQSVPSSMTQVSQVPNTDTTDSTSDHMLNVSNCTVNDNYRWVYIHKLNMKYGVVLGLPLLTVVKLNIKPGSQHICTLATLECMPESRYGAKPIYSLNDDPETEHVESVLNSSQGTMGYADSDATEEYWPVDIEEAKGTVESDSTHSAKKARKATK